MSITGLVSLGITVATILISFGVMYGGIKTQIGELSKKVEKHNNLIERMAVAEMNIKASFRRLDELREELKDHEHGE